MNSACPDCWGYDDTHPCLCSRWTDETTPQRAAAVTIGEFGDAHLVASVDVVAEVRSS